MSNTVYKNFKIEELFTIHLSKGDNKPSELKKGNIPLVSSGQSNNGIVDYIESGDGISQLFHGGCLTADMFGNVYYQPHDFYAVSHGRVNIMVPKKTMTKQVLLFITASLFHLPKKYSYSSMLTSKKLLKVTATLPATPEGEPDFEFMSSFIRHKEEENARKLESYLATIGLKNLGPAESNSM